MMHSWLHDHARCMRWFSVVRQCAVGAQRSAEPRRYRRWVSSLFRTWATPGRCNRGLADDRRHQRPRFALPVLRQNSVALSPCLDRSASAILLTNCRWRESGKTMMDFPRFVERGKLAASWLTRCKPKEARPGQLPSPVGEAALKSWKAGVKDSSWRWNCCSSICTSSVL